MASLIPRRRRQGRGFNPNRLTASGARVTRRDGEKVRRSIQPWQQQAFYYYDKLGVIKYAAQFYSRLISNVTVYAGEVTEDGDVKPTTNDAAREAVDRIQDPGGGRTNLLGSYGRLMFLTGEAIMFVTKDADTGSDQWEMLSCREVRYQDGRWYRLRAPSLGAEEYREAPDDAFEVNDERTGVGYRLWRPHPEFSWLADATMQAVLEDCVALGTMVSTPTGARRVEDICAGDDVYAWENGEMVVRPVSATRAVGERDTLLVTAGRRTIRCTSEHPLLVARQDKPGSGRKARTWTEWVHAEDLQTGDYLVVASRIPSQLHGWVLPDGTPGTADIAYFLGQFCGDGHATQYSVVISVYNEERAASLERIVGDAWGLAARRCGRGNGDVRWNSAALVRTLRLLGLVDAAPEKAVPPIVWQMPDAHKRAFLRGYEDADGHLTPQGWQSHATASEGLARELRHLYIELGENVSNIHVQERPTEGMTIRGRTVVAARPLHRFQVYYGSRRRGQRDVLRTDAQRRVIGEMFTLAKVKRVELAGVAETFDISVPGPACFIADGVVAHNCEELLALTRAVRSRARSRLPNGGLLMIPDELTIVPMEPVGDEDPEEDPFLADFTDALMQPMTDEGAASSVVPYVLRGDGDALAKVRHLQVIDPTLYYPESGLRRECIDRIAIGIDLPPEILTGTGDVNHWGSWQIDESTWKSHGQPLTQQLCDDLTAAYLRPMLMSQRVAGWDRFVVGYDATSVINHPDRSRDAKDLHDRGAIGDEALRDAAGFDEDSAPTDQERIVWIARVARDPGFAVTGIPSRPTAEGATSVDVAAARESSVGDGGKTLPGESSAETKKGPPPEPTTTASGNGHGPEAYRVLGAAEAALLRARELVGNRIANQARRHGRDAERLVEGVARAKVAATLGPERLREFGCGSSADLAASARPWLVDAVAGCGVDRARADRLARFVEQHLARTLYEDPPPPLPASFVNYAAGLVEAPA